MKNILATVYTAYLPSSHICVHQPKENNNTKTTYMNWSFNWSPSEDYPQTYII